MATKRQKLLQEQTKPSESNFSAMLLAQSLGTRSFPDTRNETPKPFLVTGSSFADALAPKQAEGSSFADALAPKKAAGSSFADALATKQAAGSFRDTRVQTPKPFFVTGSSFADALAPKQPAGSFRDTCVQTPKPENVTGSSFADALTGCDILPQNLGNVSQNFLEFDNIQIPSQYSAFHSVKKKKSW